MATEPLKLATLTGMQSFEPCNRDGEAYTADSLKSMALNWSEFRTRMEPPLVVGHEENQPLVDNTGSPAIGWLNDVAYAEAPDRNGKTRPVLLTGAHEVQPAWARAIENKEYKKVSIEPWKRPPEQMFDGRDHILDVLSRRGIDTNAALWDARKWAAAEHGRLTVKVAEGKLARTPSLDWLVDFRLRDQLGPMVRRLAVLGGTPPYVGTLTDIPMPVFSDRRRDGLSTDEEWERFMATDTATAPASTSEAKRAQLEDFLSKAGWSDPLITALEAVPNSKFQNLVLVALADAAGIADMPTDGTADPAVAAEESTEDPAAVAAEDAGTPTPEEMVADLVALGYAEADLTAMSPEELLALWQQEKGQTMSAAKVKPVVTPARKPTPAADGTFAAEVAAQIFEQKRVLDQNSRRLAAQIAMSNRRAEAEARVIKQRLDAERKRAVDAIIEQATAGPTPKILPSQVDRYKRRLMDADMLEVRKFGDKSVTAFEDIVDEINNLPSIRFFASEKVKQGGQHADVDKDVSDYIRRRHGKRQTA